MSKYLLSCFLVATTIFMAHKDTFGLDKNPCYDFSKEPPFLSESAKPSTTLLVDFSGSLNEHAYQDREVKWDTGDINATAYSGYNATKKYYGYFDEDSYYVQKNNIFQNSTEYSPDSWSGHFLNWVSMHRIDILKKALTGGVHTTTTDSDNETYIYTVSKTDEPEKRGKFHIADTNSFNDTEVIPEEFKGKKLGFEQNKERATLKIF